MRHFKDGWALLLIKRRYIYTLEVYESCAEHGSDLNTVIQALGRLTRAQAEEALTADETPVGCVFVHDGKILGRGMNDTNRSLNVSRVPATSALALREDRLMVFKGTRHAELVAMNGILKRHDLSILAATDLYVTVEPCIMCASTLRQYKIRSVYYGCVNERFGGTGGLLSVHSE